MKNPKNKQIQMIVKPIVIRYIYCSYKKYDFYTNNRIFVNSASINYSIMKTMQHIEFCNKLYYFNEVKKKTCK